MGDFSKKKRKELDLKYNFKVLWNFLQKYRLIFYLIIFITFITEIISFADSFFFKYLIDKAELLSQHQLEINSFGQLLLWAVLIFLGIKIIGTILWYILMELINRMEGGLMNDIENKSFWHVLSLSYRFHLNKKTGSLISQFTRGVSKVESFVDAVIFNFFPALFRFILSIGVIFYFDTWTAVALSITTVAFMAAGIIVTYYQKESQNEANDREDLLKHNLGDIFFNIETVKYFAKEKPTFNYFSKLSQELKDSRIKFWNHFSWMVAIQTLILGVGLAAIFYSSFNSFKSGILTLGAITLIYTAVWKLIPQLYGLMHGYRQFMRSGVDVSALFALYKEKNEVVDATNAKELKVKEGEIKFDNVSFTYPQRDKRRSSEAVLKIFDLIVKPHQKVALVGPSGGGKTTVVKLLYRLFDLNSGRILIDGQDISKVKQQSLRENLSIVPQEPILFDNTLYFNIAYANPKASKEEVWKAIKMAHLDRLIEKLPKKEKTLIGERGVKLSGGEKQRVSIARALLNNKKVLILDEATSALDSATEKEIQADLEELMKNRTSIIIAHRRSTIIKAALIVVLNKGEIAEKGTHQELLQKENGLYKKLWNIQRGAEILREE